MRRQFCVVFNVSSAAVFFFSRCAVELLHCSTRGQRRSCTAGPELLHFYNNYARVCPGYWGFTTLVGESNTGVDFRCLLSTPCKSELCTWRKKCRLYFSALPVSVNVGALINGCICICLLFLDSLKELSHLGMYSAVCNYLNNANISVLLALHSCDVSKSKSFIQNGFQSQVINFDQKWKK